MYSKNYPISIGGKFCKMTVSHIFEAGCKLKHTAFPQFCGDCEPIPDIVPYVESPPITPKTKKDRQVRSTPVRGDACPKCGKKKSADAAQCNACRLAEGKINKLITIARAKEAMQKVAEVSEIAIALRKSLNYRVKLGNMRPCKTCVHANTSEKGRLYCYKLIENAHWNANNISAMGTCDGHE